MKNKSWLTRISLLLMFLLMVLGEQSFAQTSIPTIHPNDLQASTDFKSLKGGDRVQVFSHLENLIKPAEVFAAAPTGLEIFIGDYKLNEASLITLLGEPDVKPTIKSWVYFLRPGECRLLIGFDEDQFVSYSVVKDCQ